MTLLSWCSVASSFVYSFPFPYTPLIKGQSLYILSVPKWSLFDSSTRWDKILLNTFVHLQLAWCMARGYQGTKRFFIVLWILPDCLFFFFMNLIGFTLLTFCNSIVVNQKITLELDKNVTSVITFPSDLLTPSTFQFLHPLSSYLSPPLLEWTLPASQDSTAYRILPLSPTSRLLRPQLCLLPPLWCSHSSFFFTLSSPGV